jgi:hypothetical protein
VKQRYPDFLGIGAQKAGTTWLHENLRYHPEIWLPPIKELQYFNDIYIPGHRKWTVMHRRTHGIQALRQHIDRVPRELWDYRFLGRTADIIDAEISDEWYGSIFALARPDQTCGELTPEYSLLPSEGIKHILRLAPGVKIVLSLRDPIERNWSHIRMIARRSAPGEADLDLMRIASFPDVVKRADYPSIISRWSQFVPQPRFLILFMDDIVARPLKLMTDVCKFLGVDFEDDMFTALAKPTHVGQPMDMPAEIYALLKEQLRPIYVEMAKLFPHITAQWLERHYANQPSGITQK